MCYFKNKGDFATMSCRHGQGNDPDMVATMFQLEGCGFFEMDMINPIKL